MSNKNRIDFPVAIVKEIRLERVRTYVVIERFKTIAEAEEFVGTLPGCETGIYGIDAPEEMLNSNVV